MEKSLHVIYEKNIKDALNFLHPFSSQFSLFILLLLFILAMKRKIIKRKEKITRKLSKSN